MSNCKLTTSPSGWASLQYSLSNSSNLHQQMYRDKFCKAEMFVLTTHDLRCNEAFSCYWNQRQQILNKPALEVQYSSKLKGSNSKQARAKPFFFHKQWNYVHNQNKYTEEDRWLRFKCSRITKINTSSHSLIIAEFKPSHQDLERIWHLLSVYLLYAFSIRLSPKQTYFTATCNGTSKLAAPNQRGKYGQ